MKHVRTSGIWLLAAIAAAGPAGPQALCAEPWSAWESAPDAPVAAAFEPFADTRNRDFVRNEDSGGSGYASVYGRAPSPGELVLSRNAAVPVPAGPLAVRVETAFVPGPKTKPPRLPADAHYATNPFLPFPAPTGTADPCVFSVQASFPADAAWPLRVPVRLPSGYWWDRDPAPERFRVRWEMRDAGGATVARGVLPDAFETNADVTKVLTVDARGDRMPAKSKDVRATPGTWNAWPFLATSAGSVLFDAQAVRDAFGPDDAAAVRFFRRAALADLHAQLLGDGAADALERLETAAPDLARTRPLAAPQFPGRSRHDNDVWHFSNTTPGRRSCRKDDSVRRDVERLLEPARIPDDTLGRATRPFLVATVVFLIAFAAGTALLLVRFFALRRGESRLAVWRALPLWCAAAGAFALLALPRFLDRAPRADVTEWRYGRPGAPEELRIAEGRFHSFATAPSSWTVPSDAWFCAIPRAARNQAPGTGPAERIDFASGIRSLALPARTRGETETVHAATFAPHEAPAVEISPDPDARAEDFLWAVEEPDAKKAGAAPDPTAREAFRRLLRDWTCGDPDSRSRVPARTVTARGDYAAVWVYARGHWYALGPMKAGETRALDRSQRVQDGMDVSDKPYGNLFAHAPFVLDKSRINPLAESWLAREKARDPKARDGAGEEPDGKKEAPHPVTREFLDRLDDAFAVALEARPGVASGPAAPQATFLAPSIGARGAVSSRIVHVEVLP